MIRRALKGWPRLVRGAAMALAALSLAWGVAMTEGLVATMAGAVLGVLAGQWLAYSRLKLSVALLVWVLISCGAWAIAGLAVDTEFFSRLWGPSNTLRIAGVLRFGSVALALTGALRVAAARRRTAMVLELGTIATAVTVVFSAHRDGVIARPLWLSDWAWQNGFDPAQVFLGVGVVAVGLLAALLLVETRSGRAISSLLVLTALAAVAMVCLNIVGRPKPRPLNDLGLTNPPPGEDPRRVPPRDGGRGPQRGEMRDGGSEDGRGNGEDGGIQIDAAGQDSSADGMTDAGGSSDGGQDGAGAGTDGVVDSSLPPLEPYDGSMQDLPPPQDHGQQRALTPSERLNEDSGPSNSPAPMAVVLLDDDYSPPSGAYYFRQEAWSQYNGSRLVATSRADADLDTLERFPSEVTAVRDAPPSAGRARVHAVVAMVVEHTYPFGLETPTTFAPVANPNPQRFVRAYKFESLAQTVDYRRLFGKTAGDSRWSPEQRAYYLAGPADPRYAQLARKIVANLPPSRRTDPFAEAVAVKLYLDRELVYSTRARHSGMADPTADFLFGNRTGYCVHFAHAAVFLWRVLGIPSRIGTGYHYDEANRHGGSTIVVRAGDAHAWPELYLDGVGWIVLDVSATRTLDPPGRPPDDDLQRLLGEMARSKPPDPYQPALSQKVRQRARGYGRELGIAGLLSVAAVLLVLYGVKLWRRIAPRLAGPRAIPRVGYRAALDLLSEGGMVRRFGETRESFALRAATLSPSFERLTEMHLSARLGNRTMDPAARPECSPVTYRQTLRAVRREVAERARGGRRWIGLFNPASWLDSR